MPWTKEEKAAYMKEYRANNKEKIAAQKKEYDANNKDRQRAWIKEYQITPKGIKSRIIGNWKRTGTIGDLSKFYDERYLPASSCEVCEKVFKSTNDKCMDHSHTTGEIRHVLCRRCNTYDNWIKVLANK